MRITSLCLMVSLIAVFAGCSDSGGGGESDTDGDVNIPAQTHYNENIEWQGYYGVPIGEKSNKIVYDEDGNVVVISCPEPSPFVGKVDGSNGGLMWGQHMTDLEGMLLGLEEIPGDGRIDYIISGGMGETRERWVARLNGDEGTVIWSNAYQSVGNQYQFDSVRNVTVGSDGFIYGSGFIQGDERDSFFVVYAGQAFVMKINPDTGDEIWTSVIDGVEFGVAHQEGADGYIYVAGALFEEDLTLTKVEKSDGSVVWTRALAGTRSIIPSDLAVGTGDMFYYGGHAGRVGAGDPFDYTMTKIDGEGQVIWTKYYANPRGYSLDHIRNELYGTKVGTDGIYMFGGSGSESDYDAEISPFPSAGTWVGWVLITDFDGQIQRSDVYAHDDVMTATEYGDLIPGGYVICNDADGNWEAGETDIGLMKVVNGYNL